MSKERKELSIKDVGLGGKAMAITVHLALRTPVQLNQGIANGI